MVPWTFVVVLLVVVGAGTLASTLAIRYLGRAQQQKYDADVSQFIAGTAPDAAHQAVQAQIEQNLADADALEAQVQSSEAAHQPPAAPPPSSSAPPDPTL